MRLVTGIVIATVTGMDADLPFEVVAITVVVPFAIGVIRPETDTVATAVLPLLQVTVLSVVFAGRIVATSWMGVRVVAFTELGATEILDAATNVRVMNGARTLPFTLPRPLHVSYPIPAEYAPLFPLTISLKHDRGYEYRRGSMKVVG